MPGTIGPPVPAWILTELNRPYSAAASASKVSDGLRVVTLIAPPELTVSGRPIASLTFALNYAIAGGTESTWSYHAVNVLIHACAALALFGPGDWQRHGPHLKTPHQRVHWAGTETSTEFFGLMEGAVRSGHRVATEILTR